MTRIVVPVRYPLSKHSKRTLSEALSIAADREGELTVLHVNLYQNGKTVTRSALKRAVEGEFGDLSNVRYAVRTGFLVEESILEEVAAEDADVVVIGHKQVGRWRRVLRRILDEPDIERYLKQRLSCQIVTVGLD
ncbi:universal stress protein [Halostella litorea]|uniref:universal stress protein n=1 Tax=Halostella litorea TaxID=2528831 RepID=UPI0010921E81|nr:universal stress protein [Halostella litorea]